MSNPVIVALDISPPEIAPQPATLTEGRNIALERSARMRAWVMAIAALLILAFPKMAQGERLTTLPGFKVELIRSAQADEGSWICMTVDPQGRLIISQQGGVSNLLRMTLLPGGKVGKVERIEQPVGSAMGLLYAFDSLYVNGVGPDGYGLYRLHDDRQEDRYDSVKLLKKLEGSPGSEHGGHAVVLGPDDHIYMVCGNFTKVPSDISPDSPCRNFAEDLLLPRAEDSLGFSVGIKPPEGFVLRTDADGKKWELICAGLRNTYDLAFNSDGELFGFDSDAECDWGLPWYRPTRILHLVPGGEYGFREGTGKWPKYYPDSLPSVLDIGIGSPTGMKFGDASNFPERYKRALYALDWSYGRIFAVNIVPRGASYGATAELFVKGVPLTLTDIEFGNDGAMYFITGGRGTQSGLYRVSYIGTNVPLADPEAPTKHDIRVAAAVRVLRHQLEQYHGKVNPTAVPVAWMHLNSEDSAIRYAARLAVESQPVAEWRDRALSEQTFYGGLTALLALARSSGAETQPQLLRALRRFSLGELNREQKLLKLRVTDLSFIRQGRPGAELAAQEITELDRQYPATDESVNAELCQLLIYLQAPNVVAKTLKLLDAAPTQEEQVRYMFYLRTLKIGWTMDQHSHYFEWFNRTHAGEKTDAVYATGPGYYPWSKRTGEQPKHSEELLKWFTDAEREYGDGCSFPAYLTNIRADAVQSLTDDERGELAPLITGQNPAPAPVATVIHHFVKDWRMEDLMPSLAEVSSGRSFTSGKAAFSSARCIQCHRFGNEGGAIGPDLTAVASRFGPRDILESILEPSRVLAEQFQNMNFMLKNGDVVTGRIVEENDQRAIVMTDSLLQTKIEIPKSHIQQRVPSKISPMPESLVNDYTREEILDLIAYLESGGKETAPQFGKK
jgi:putative heme-binding domain-containing protein